MRATTLIAVGMSAPPAMFGDTPPTVIVVDEGLLCDEGHAAALARTVADRMRRQRLWLVSSEPDRLVSALASLDIRLPLLDDEIPDAGHGALVIGDALTAVALAEEAGGNDVRVWCDGAIDLDMELRILAHDGGIKITVEAPLSGGHAAA